MRKDLTAIQKVLRANSSEANKKFFKKVVPGIQTTYGVRTPVLNALAKKYREGTFQLAEGLWHSGAFEEKIIAIKILEKAGKTDPAQLLTLFKTFSRQIDNWAICDGLGMQFLRSVVKTHRTEIFDLARKMNHSKDPWQRRLSLVMVEWYTRHAENHAEIIELTKNLEGDREYYVRKAIAWIKRNLKKGK